MGTVTYTLDENSKLSEQEKLIIENASKKAINYDEDCPELSPEQLKNFKMAYPQNANLVKIDDDVLRAFMQKGSDYIKRINSVLRNAAACL